MCFHFYGNVNFHWLITEKGKMGLYCYLTVDILIKVFTEMFSFFSSIVALATERLNAGLSELRFSTMLKLLIFKRNS